MGIGAGAVIVVGAVLCAAAAVSSAPLSDMFSVDAHILASGSSQRLANACFRLRNTAGEPVAGYSSSTDYAMAAGFRARRTLAPRDDILFDSFEACTP